MRQKTIKSPITLEGVGLHTGAGVKVVLAPAPENTGRMFIRTDLADRPQIPASDRFLGMGDLYRRTTLQLSQEIKLHTVEHLMAALAALGVDNVIMEISGDELPFFDGSSLPFVEALEGAGLVEQEADVKCVELQKPVLYSDGPVEVLALPARELRLTFFVDYDDKVIGRQSLSFRMDAETFRREIAPARTYVFMKDVESLRQAGLIKGGSLDSAVVIAEDRIVNDELRFPDEIVRHKLLDLLGDLALLGAPLHAHVMAVRSGHQSHAAFLKLLRKEVGPHVV
ncbi:MAG: UDP-3-O-acyl-N-acetylglucosamine deacetylase [bacterium]